MSALQCLLPLPGVAAAVAKIPHVVSDLWVLTNPAQVGTM